MTKLNHQIRTIVVDDHALVRSGLRLLFEESPGFVLLDEARDGREGVAKVVELQPDIVILDVLMPCLGGIEAAHEIGRLAPEVRVLGLSMRDDSSYAREMLLAGASGYLTKATSHGELVTAMRRVLSGEKVVSPPLSAFLTPRRKATVTKVVDRLTFREREILRRFAEGATNKDIAVELDLSTHTVHAHRSNIMKKLELHSLAEIVRFAVRHGLVA